MKTLMIIAAGNGSRLGIETPKALVHVKKNKPVILDTLEKIGILFDEVYIVANKLHKEYWEQFCFEYKRPFNVTILYIESGRGDGHAVLMALENFRDIPEDITVCWGDVVFKNGFLVKDLLSRKMKNGIVPCEYVQNPYVTIFANKKNEITHAEFSKYGEINKEGLHDLSIFRFVGLDLWASLYEMDKLMNRGGKYNGELSTLFVFHYLYNSNSPLTAYITDEKTFSFNTPEELDKIKDEYASW